MTARALALLASGPLGAAIARGAPDPLPAEPPIGGILWSVVVPAFLLAVALAATVMLYRHFSARGR